MLTRAEKNYLMELYNERDEDFIYHPEECSCGSEEPLIAPPYTSPEDGFEWGTCPDCGLSRKSE